MPEFKYSIQNFEPLTHVRASGREIDISPKATREVCVAIKGLTINRCKKFLEEVIQKKIAVPFRRFKKKGAHKSSLQGFHTGGYPVKAAKEVLKIVENLEANADFKGMDTEKVVIIHSAVMKGRVIKGFKPRAFGRSSPDYNILSHVELVGKEVL